MVDTAALINDLSAHGTVIYCEPHETLYYLIVVDNWDSDIPTFNTIANTYLSVDYPNQVIVTLDNQLIKSQFNQ
jgi:hypothetical protein